jgi:hypothetical protein
MARKKSSESKNLHLKNKLKRKNRKAQSNQLELGLPSNFHLTQKRREELASQDY